LTRRYLHTIKREEAVRLVLERLSPLEEEEYLPAHQCRGRVTARPVYAVLSNPPFICSAMDGYATPFQGTMEADVTRPVVLAKGAQAFRVNTGDPMPSGTDAVVMREDVEEADAHITIRRPVYLWQNVRMAGEDVIEGDMLAPTNHRIRAFDVGMFLSGGVRAVFVKRKPTCLIIPTGKELVDPYEERVREPSQSRLIDFNSYTLLVLSEELGFRATQSGIIVTKDDLKTLLTKASSDYDVILVNAGSSAGSEDFTEDVISELGELVFHGVSMMPGKPVIFGVVKGTPVFGIPGYPVSAVMSFKAFLEPLYEKISNTRLIRRRIKCVTPYKIPSRIGVEEILRVSLVREKGVCHAFPLPRGASIFSSMAKADGLITIPEHVEGYNEGEELDCDLMVQEDVLSKRIHIVGSHDLSLDVLRDMVKRRYPESDLISTHVGSMSGIIALGKGITSLCTTHILDEEKRIYNIPALIKYIPEKKWTLVHIAKRMQGLLVRQGNPKKINDVTDLARSDILFVNRQSGSGTRILFDTLLKDRGLRRGSIRGYDREESSHTAVGVLVKEGIADAGIGIYGVSKLFSLDCIPLMEEDYDLLVAGEFHEDERFTHLLDLIRSAEFKARLEEMGGYNTKETGTIKYVNK
jgi:putative molybdopterin biosynthesis protein